MAPDKRKEKMKLSIIICVYNTDKTYLDRCLYSLTNSTLGYAENFISDDVEYEIIFIDDGSSVDYTDLLAKYSVNYTKTENQGIFSARALGVSLATGDYIAFCDSDDTVSFNYHLPMLLKAKKRDADIVINDWAFHTAKARYYCKNDSTIKENLSLSKDAVITKFMEQAGREHSYYVLWNKIYKSAILKGAIDKCREYIENIKSFSYSEDALINFFAHSLAQSLENVHTGWYFYRIHDNQTVSVASESKLLSHIKCMTKTLDIMEEEILKRENSNSLISYLNSWREYMSRSHYSHARANGYTSLFPVIREDYKIEKLRKARYSDGKAYHKNKLIGMNIEDIDNSLLEIFRGDSVVIAPPKRKSYAERTLAYMKGVGIPFWVDKWGIKIPKEKISLKRKILLNPLVYNLGMLLFPKGSKIRAFLKRKV